MGLPLFESTQFGVLEMETEWTSGIFGVPCLETNPNVVGLLACLCACARVLEGTLFIWVLREPSDNPRL